MCQLMEQQPKVPPAVLTGNELRALGEQIQTALSWIQDLGIPNTLGHLDLNPGNVIVAGEQCVFLDWAEAYVGHPFLSFQHLLELFRRMVGVDKKLEGQLTEAYADSWRRFISPESIAEALALTPLVAVFVFAAASDAWSKAVSLRDPKSAGYFRSLTRRMNREANQLEDRRAPCPS
jgi:hypothetical protein